jgi:hypothetical protein
MTILVLLNEHTCPLTIFPGLAVKGTPPAANETQSKAFSRYRILLSLSEKSIKNNFILMSLSAVFT